MKTIEKAIEKQNKPLINALYPKYKTKYSIRWFCQKINSSSFNTMQSKNQQTQYYENECDNLE